MTLRDLGVIALLLLAAVLLGAVLGFAIWDVWTGPAV